MRTVELHGKTYRVSPGGCVWAAYTRPSQPEMGVLWRRMETRSKLSQKVRCAAGIEPEKPPPVGLPKHRLYGIY